jgi:hypothetical protein
MKFIYTFLLITILSNSYAMAFQNSFEISIKNIEKIDIKVKNDSNHEVTVYNASSGGTYRLQKNITTTIKMEVGDKLYYYEGGKKGKLLLTADASMKGKLHLYSKL